LHAKGGSITQIPANAVAVYFKSPAALILGDSILPGRKQQRAGASRAKAKILERKSLNPALCFSFAGEPSGPDLNWLLQRLAATPIAARTAEQIAEPPCAAAISETEPQKPHFVTTTHRELRERLVECFHGARQDNTGGGAALAGITQALEPMRLIFADSIQTTID